MADGWSPNPGGDRDLEIAEVATVLDPILVPLDFAPAQLGASGSAAQVIYCRGLHGSTDGACVDLVIDLVADPDWRIVDVRYWGFTSDRWHLPFDHQLPLADQLTGLAHRLPDQLA